MAQRPLRSTLAALLLGATLMIPCLTGSAARADEATPRRPAASTSPPSRPFDLLWQTLIQLVQGKSFVGMQAATGRRPLPDAGCSLNPDGRCETN